MHAEAEALVTECIRDLQAAQESDDHDYGFLQSEDTLPLFPQDAFPDHLLHEAGA
jgi:hypothetical protein